MSLSMFAASSLSLQAPMMASSLSFRAPTTGLTMNAESAAYTAVVPPNKIGNYGFDPLGLGSEETFVPFREAEIKHGRLAMLAAVGWPLQEIVHPFIVDNLRASNALAPFFVRDVLAETAGKAPSLLNGGLEQIEVAPSLGFAVFLSSVLELQDLKAREAKGLKFNEFDKSRVPGDLSFDPLNIYSSLPYEEQVDFMEKELMNGRLAMLAVTAYAAIEFFFDMPVVRFTPDLFEPLIFAPDFRAFMDNSFGMASMDGSIDGVAF